MEFNEDAYWENRREEYEGANLEIVANCDVCGCDLVEGSNCYYIDKRFYCENCISDFHITLESDM